MRVLVLVLALVFVHVLVLVLGHLRLAVNLERPEGVERNEDCAPVVQTAQPSGAPRRAVRAPPRALLPVYV